MRFAIALLCVCIIVATDRGFAAESDPPAAGHSYHGEAFNEGPRQAAVLMEGMSGIDFPTSTKSEKAQAFFEQGIAALHGFWYLEAERSFRQAALEDPEMAIAYWGMAMANLNNDQRARGFIDNATEKSKTNTTKREKRYIQALDRYLPSEESLKAKEKAKDKKEQSGDDDRDAKRRRGERYIADLEKILHEHPNDVEAKAFLVVQMWMEERNGVKLTSRYAVNALMDQIFAANPNHPAHHYRIHLWDYPRPENAVRSAALCGPSSPGIAHMWHMPGHIYSKLKRYGDAAWQQEASARVDHAHMIRTRLMPDQIHNFAHNNEWLIRNLIHLGRVEDATDLARNMISLPKHPSFNTLDQRGSHKYGRQRLIQVLAEFGLWKELSDEFEGTYLSSVDHTATRMDELSWQSVAKFLSGERAEGARLLRQLRREKLTRQQKLLDLADDTEMKSDAKKETTKSIQDEIKMVDRYLPRAAATAAAVRKDVETLKKQLKSARLDASIEARLYFLAGDSKTAIDVAKKAVAAGKNEVIPLAIHTDLLWKTEKTDEAKKQFELLRRVAGEADIRTPLLANLQPVADAMDIAGDWRTPADPADDLGERPLLDDLGPFRWQPYPSQPWQARSPDDQLVVSKGLDSQPRLVIFYLGAGCLHCVEQLQEFGPRADEFRDAGIDILAISTESHEELVKAIDLFDEDIAIPLLSDGDQQSFRDYRCWDDFESLPLHGTFLIDTDGYVRWQDISYEPFMDVDFLLKESKRLLELP
ncbi:MAG: redoxin domain-containing protein [Planctomycetota bacterium]